MFNFVNSVWIVMSTAFFDSLIVAGICEQVGAAAG